MDASWNMASLIKTVQFLKLNACINGYCKKYVPMDKYALGDIKSLDKIVYIFTIYDDK